MPSKPNKVLRFASTFIGDYMKQQEATETPENYDFWTAVWAIGNVVGRRVYVARPHAPVYLNWYMILVAESGTTRKSSSVRAVTNLIREHISYPVEMIEGKTSPEKLEIQLALQTINSNSANAILSISELVTILGRERYALGMPGLLTDLYDSPSFRGSPGTISHGSLELRNVFVSLLSASTPAWLAGAINPSVVEGGFTSRCLFITASGPKRRVAWPDEVSSELSGAVHQQLTRIAIEAEQHKGGITLSKEALTTFSKWYQQRKLSSEPYLASFESREDAHVLRLAACLCINDHSWQIQKEHIQFAIRMVEDAKRNGNAIFSLQQTKHDRLAAGIDRLCTQLVLADRNGISGTNLSVRLARFFNRAELQTALSIMHELALVQKFKLRSDGAGRPTTIWRATKALVADGAQTIIKERMSEL